MSIQPSKISSEIQQLSSILLSTLDETIFFSELAQYLMKHVACEKARVFVVLEDSSVKLVSENGRPIIDGKELMIGEGPAGHVVRTKRPYFSNNVARDPLFAHEASEGITAELCMPITFEGVLIATVHLQRISEGVEFVRENISSILNILSELKHPLANMKLYLSAKSLNEILLKKIEEKERELEERKSGGKVESGFKTLEKEIIGKSQIMQNLFSLADKSATGDIHLLITGDSGTGKELLARRIHCRSRRKDAAYLVLDCSALNEEQLEKEIFGHIDYDVLGEKEIHRGLLESADNGTLVLKKISKMNFCLQAKLAQFIKSGSAQRIGEASSFKSDVRLIVVSSDKIEALGEGGLLREDLFYAISKMRLSVPALKDRKDDIELLAYYFLNSDKNSTEHKTLSPCVVKVFNEYSWPGNIRELQNIVERAYILAESEIIDRNHLSDIVLRKEIKEEVKEDNNINFKELTLEELEKMHICSTLEHLSGNKTKTAKLLGITVKTLYNKLHNYGMIGNEEKEA